MILCPSLIAPGGVERVVTSISSILANGYTVFECSFDPRDSRRHFESPAEFIPLGRSLRLPLVLRLISYAVDVMRLRRVKRSLRVDITISNLWRADLLNVLSGGPDKKIAIWHINVEGNPSNKVMLRLLPLVRAIYHRFDRLVAVSRPLADEVGRLYGVEARRISVIYNPLGAAVSQPEKRTDGRVRAVWCGRMVKEKNVVVLADIFAATSEACPSLQLVLIGDGVLREMLEARLRQLKLRCGCSLLDLESDVIMTGLVEEPAALLAQCDLQLAPSSDEGLGMAVIEGFAAGLPVIAANCRGGGLHDALDAPESYRPGRTKAQQTTCGFLLPVPHVDNPATINMWRDHLITLATNTSLRVQLSEGCRARVLAFAPDVARSKWVALIESLTVT